MNYKLWKGDYNSANYYCVNDFVSENGATYMCIQDAAAGLTPSDNPTHWQPMASQGLSAYEAWLALGNSGTESDFINSIRGPQGDVGQTGSGEQGASAYQSWLNLGNSGSEQDFLNSLHGQDAQEQGPAGPSAYQSWLNLGNSGSEQDFINSLRGPAGNDGAPGSHGADGQSYNQGPPGEKGDKGDTGAQGNQGNDGQSYNQGAQGVPGNDGSPGAPGSNGNDGAPGVGVPAGGSTGQVLTKIDGSDFNTQWTTPQNLAQQSGHGDQTAGESYTSTEQQMLQDVYTALRNLGLLS